MSVLLLVGFLVLLSTKNSSYYKKLLSLQKPPYGPSPCDHSIDKRRHLGGVMQIISFIEMQDVQVIDLLFNT